MRTSFYQMCRTRSGNQYKMQSYVHVSCKCFGYTEWEHLIEQIETFEFCGTSGFFTARKEKRANSCAYWYAYTWGTMGRRKTYLGRPAELTLARLENMAKKLNEQ